MKSLRHHPWNGAAALLIAAAFCLSGCSGGGSTPSGPDPEPEPGPQGNARLTFEVLLPAAEEQVAEYAADWSEDGTRVVYAGPPGSTIWTRPARAGSVATAVTDPELGNWLTGAYAPGVIDGDRVAYSLNWHGNELGMFLLTAPAGSVEGVPGPDLLHLFAGSDVGLPENQFSSPLALTYSADGLRAAGVWREPWVLDWREDTFRTENPPAMEGGDSPRISRDGLRLVFTDKAGAVVWMVFEETIGENVGTGFHPSWRDDARILGYLGANGHYGLYNLETRSTTWYRVDGPAPVLPVLSRDGRRVVYLYRDEERRLGLAVGDLLLD